MILIKYILYKAYLKLLPSSCVLPKKKTSCKSAVQFPLYPVFPSCLKCKLSFMCSYLRACLFLCYNLCLWVTTSASDVFWVGSWLPSGPPLGEIVGHPEVLGTKKVSRLTTPTYPQPTKLHIMSCRQLAIGLCMNPHQPTVGKQSEVYIFYHLAPDTWLTV